MNWYTSASFTVLEIYVDDTFLQICCCALQCLSFMACHVEITIFKIVRVVWRSASSITTSTTSSNTFKLNIKNVVLTLQRRKWKQLFSNILEVFAISYNKYLSYFCTVTVGVCHPHLLCTQYSKYIIVFRNIKESCIVYTNCVNKCNDVH